jgi:hypothetical protein
MKKVFSLFLLPLLIFLFNVYLIFPQFQGELTQYNDSIEISYIQAGKFLADFSHHTWNPLWYNGFPFHVLYNPVFPYLEWFIFKTTHLSWGQIYRILTALAYSFIPVSFYFLVRYLYSSSFIGFLSAEAYALLPSFNYLFSGPRSYGQIFSWAPWHFITWIKFGEGTHTLGLAFLPLTTLAFIYALRRPYFRFLLLATFLNALVALTSMIALWALFILEGVILISEAVLPRNKNRIKTASKIFILFLGLIAFWFNPDFIKTSFGFGQGSNILINYYRFLLYLPLLAALFFALLITVFNRHSRQNLFIALFWFLPLFLFAFAWYKWQIAFAPQAIRYMPELNMAFIMILAFLVFSLGRYLKQKLRIGKIIFLFTFSSLILLIVYFSRNFISSASIYVQPLKKPISQTYEYQVSKEIEKIAQENRVYLTGNNAFYLNLYTFVPQLRGGLDQAATNKWWNHVTYQLNKGESEKIARYLVKAMNLVFVLVNTPSSSNVYHDFNYPEKFASWEKVFAREGDILYKSPLKTPSLFQLVDKERYFQLKKPVNAVDEKNLRAYALWIDDNASSEELEVNWVDNGQIRIKGNFPPDKILSAQITFDPGWQAFSENHKLKIKEDVMSHMVIFPLKEGKQEIILKYKKPLSVKLGYLVSLVTLLFIVLWPLKLRAKYQELKNKVEEMS